MNGVDKAVRIYKAFHKNFIIIFGILMIAFPIVRIILNR